MAPGARASRHFEATIGSHAPTPLIAIAVAVVVAGVAGVYIGLQARVTPEELTEQARMEEEASELTDIVGDVMDELWRMEDVEAARNGR